MLYHTKDPGEKAASIADRQAEVIWSETRSFDAWLKAWEEVYAQVLFEFNFGYFPQ